MTYDCSCNWGEPASVYNATNPRARKPYQCEECDGPILVGEQYERVFGVWEGYATTFRTCERCHDLRVWVRNNVPCLCVMHGNMDEEMEEAIIEAYLRAPDEVIGLKFGFLRRKLLRDRLNRQRRAN